MISLQILRNSSTEVFYKERCSQKFRKIRSKTLCQSLFFNKIVQALGLQLF